MPAHPHDDPPAWRSPWLIGSTLILAGVLWIHGLMLSHAYPCLDDWGVASVARDNGVISALTSYWNGQGGRWISALLIDCLGLCSDMIAIYPLAMAASTVAILGSVIPLILAAGLRGARRDVAIILLPLALVAALPAITYGNLPWHVPTFETLLWASGSWSYALALPLITTAIALAMVWDSRWCSAVICSLGITIAGFSETSAILALSSGCLLALCGARRGWWFAAAAAVGLGICSLAPGNLVRAAKLDSGVTHVPISERLPEVVLIALLHTANRLQQWLLSPSQLVAMALAASLAGPVGGDRSLWQRRTVTILIALPAVVALAVLPSLFLVGLIEGRQEGIISLVCCLWLIAAAWCAGRAYGGTGIRWKMALLLAILTVLHLLVSPLPWSPLAHGGIPIAGALIATGLLAWSLRGTWPPLAMAAAATLLATPWTWQMADDLRGPLPRLQQARLQRDTRVREFIAQGHVGVALPWLGDQAELPVSGDRYEIQRNWIGDGYAAYMHVRRYVIVPRLDRVKIWKQGDEDRPTPPDGGKVPR